MEVRAKNYDSRRNFIGGSDARVLMGIDEARLLRLGRRKPWTRLNRL